MDATRSARDRPAPRLPASCTTTRPRNSRVPRRRKGRSRSRWANRQRAHLRRGSSGARPARRSAPALRSLPRSPTSSILRRRVAAGRRLDQDRCPRTTRCQAFERGKFRQRKAERVPNRGRDVDNVLGRRRKRENDVIVPSRHQDDARAGGGGTRRTAQHAQIEFASANSDRAKIPKGRRFAAAMPRLSQCLVNHRVGGMPKTLTGRAAARRRACARLELFLVDGSNLAYRAFFALPEELQTTDGQPTNALLGTTCSSSSCPTTPREASLVAWDTRPVRGPRSRPVQVRTPADARPAPRAVHPFRPIVEAFGYRNLEFEAGSGRRDRNARDPGR